MHKIIIFFILAYSIPVAAYETGGWPGEGIPVISFKKTSYVFCKSPKVDKSCVSKKVRIGIKMTLNDYNQKYIRNSKYITIKPVVMTAKEDFIIREGKIPVRKGMKLLNYQYAAEGYCQVGINGKVYEVALYEYKAYLNNSDKEPQTEWWIEVVNKGWLKLTSGNVNYHDREF